MQYSAEEALKNLRHNLKTLVERKAVEMPEDALNQVMNQEKSLTVDELLVISELSGHSLSMLLNHRLNGEKADIKMLVMDCDGVLTDGGMTFTKNGDEIKKFNAKDGQGIKRAQKAGMLTGIISAGISTGLVEKRAEMLGIPLVYVGKRPKLEVLEDWLKELKLELSQIAYIGDDISDITILQKAGISACPSDAVRQVRNICDVVLSLDGGNGCVRELIDEHLLPE